MSRCSVTSVRSPVDLLPAAPFLESLDRFSNHPPSSRSQTARSFSFIHQPSLVELARGININNHESRDRRANRNSLDRIPASRQLFVTARRRNKNPRSVGQLPPARGGLSQPFSRRLRDANNQHRNQTAVALSPLDLLPYTNCARGETGRRRQSGSTATWIKIHLVRPMDSNLHAKLQFTIQIMEATMVPVQHFLPKAMHLSLISIPAHGQT